MRLLHGIYNSTQLINYKLIANFYNPQHFISPPQKNIQSQSRAPRHITASTVRDEERYITCALIPQQLIKEWNSWKRQSYEKKIHLSDQ